MICASPSASRSRFAISTKPHMATLEKAGEDEALATFDEPQRAITPGQAAVFYDGDVVVGGGWIT